jgi:peroxiredoxin Q/BCP
MTLQVGDKIPDFSAKDSKGNDFDSASVVGKKLVVFYFYPKDNTPGCTAQACSFRDQYEDFKDLGAEVIGISSDSIASHQKFAKQHHLPFTLLSDNDKKLRNLFGVKPSLFGLIPGRVTYVVDRNGIIQLIFDSLVATNHIPRALEKIKKIVSENSI